MTAAKSSSGARTSVLIVGAGPAGLVAALRLREEGVDVRIIDEQTAEAKHTYPVLLHPRTLRILDALGVTAPLEWRGRSVARLAVHTDDQRRLVLELPSAGYPGAGAMTLPQDVLRRALMYRLSTFGTEVEWQTRLLALHQDERHVHAGLVRRERVEGPAPELKHEWLDVASETVEAELVIGADGTRSTVRQLLGIDWKPYGHRELYVFYDAPDVRAGDEAHLVLNGTYGSSVYPLQGSASRFSFEIGVAMPHAPGLSQLQQLIASRVPWYSKDASSFEWSGTAEFQPALAASFGAGRIWLAGDAAHSTGPLGAQSLNVGMAEGNDLALRTVEALGRSADLTFGARYAEQRRIEWQRLFGGPHDSLVGPHSAEWVTRNLAKLLPGLPASGDDLDDLLDQLRVRLA